MAQILSGQCYGFSKNFENFYPDRDLGSEGTFGGPRSITEMKDFGTRITPLDDVGWAEMSKSTKMRNGVK